MGYELWDENLAGLSVIANEEEALECVFGTNGTALHIVHLTTSAKILANIIQRLDTRHGAIETNGLQTVCVALVVVICSFVMPSACASGSKSSIRLSAR